jgi:ligand-binding SRPBCC domain-containing protein
MPRFEFELTVAAPVERVFDLARSIDLHVVSTEGTNERPVAGVTTGLIGLGESVTWQATHFGVAQRLTSRITAFERPSHFRDEMVRGAFSGFEHDHFFEATEDGTCMREVFNYRTPLGPLGRLADRLFLRSYMERFLLRRAEVLKDVAESDDWQRYLRE